MAAMADDLEIDDADLERLLADDDEDDTGDGNGDDQPPSDWKPPTYAEWKAEQAKTATANSNAKNLRLKFKEYRTQHGPKPAPPVNGQGGQQGGQGGTGKTEAEIRAELAAEFKAKQDAASVQTEAVTALVAAGLQLPKDAGKRAAVARRAIKLMDLDGVEAGDADGIAAAIAELQEDYPGLFGSAKTEDDEDDTRPPKARRTRVGGPGARSTKSDGRAMSTNEQLAQALLRSGAFNPGGG